MKPSYYRHVLACGHREWSSVISESGSKWCEPCKAYVLVLSTRQPGRAHPTHATAKRLAKRH